MNLNNKIPENNQDTMIFWQRFLRIIILIIDMKDKSAAAETKR